MLFQASHARYRIANKSQANASERDEEHSSSTTVQSHATSQQHAGSKDTSAARGMEAVYESQINGWRRAKSYPICPARWCHLMFLRAQPLISKITIEGGPKIQAQFSDDDGEVVGDRNKRWDRTGLRGLQVRERYQLGIMLLPKKQPRVRWSDSV